MTSGRDTLAIALRNSMHKLQHSTTTGFSIPYLEECIVEQMTVTRCPLECTRSTCMGTWVECTRQWQETTRWWNPLLCDAFLRSRWHKHATWSITQTHSWAATVSSLVLRILENRNYSNQSFDEFKSPENSTAFKALLLTCNDGSPALKCCR